MMLLQKPYKLIVLSVWTLVLFTGIADAKEAASDTQFKSLFNETSLEGWDGDPRFWRVEEGAIIGQTAEDNKAEKNTFLIYRGGEFANFELRFRYKIEGYNSGVQYRSVDRGDWVVAGYQCDFEARFRKKDGVPFDKYSGMFFEESGRMFLGQRGDAVIVRPGGEGKKKATIEKIGTVGDPAELASHINPDGWNELIVIAKGNQFTHLINGHVMAIGFDEDETKRRSTGILAFQLHRGPPMRIDLKDIRIREIE